MKLHKILFDYYNRIYWDRICDGKISKFPTWLKSGKFIEVFSNTGFEHILKKGDKLVITEVDLERKLFCAKANNLTNSIYRYKNIRNPFCVKAVE